MRIYHGTTVDYEFAELGTLGYSGTLNDRQFAALRAERLHRLSAGYVQTVRWYS